MVLSLFVRPSIHVHEPILCLVRRLFAVRRGVDGGSIYRGVVKSCSFGRCGGEGCRWATRFREVKP
jgi:hypothetical protein